MAQESNDFQSLTRGVSVRQFHDELDTREWLTAWKF